MEEFQKQKRKGADPAPPVCWSQQEQGGGHKYKTEWLTLASKTKAELSHWCGLASSALSTRYFCDLVTFSPHLLGLTYQAPLFSSLLDSSHPWPCWCTKISHLLWKTMVMVQQMSVRPNRKALEGCVIPVHAKDNPLNWGQLAPLCCQ